MQGLLNREHIEDAISLVDQNILLLESIAEDYTDLEFIIPQEISIPNNSTTAIEREKILEERKSGVLKDQRYGQGKFITSDNVHVRSRAELILYEVFKSNNLNFEYEPEVIIDGELWNPDFRIVQKDDGLKIIWEHFGMMDDPNYAANAWWKIYKYARNGYLPFQNLVCTFGDRNSGLDVRYIEDILQVMRLK